MGPRKASEMFLERHRDAAAFEVTLYGSLAATGRGHLTDVAILDTLRPHAPVEIVWKPSVFLPFHPNGMTFRSKNSRGEVTDEWTVFSIGGGALAEEGKALDESPELYEMNHMTEILNWCERTGRSYWEYVQECEDDDLWNYLAEVWAVMRQAIERGLDQEGVLPGPLNLRRKASSYYIKAKGYKDSLKSRGLVFAYALAVSEENASISGAEVGCQGEVGVACAMASAAASQLFGGSPAQIEYAAEMGLEHHLGMTCDPVCGLVQIPCIERNAYAAARALDANIYSAFTDGNHRVSFDKVVAVMKQTGHDLPSLYKETGEGGLAKDYEQM